jgi:hypothetical protein
MLIFEWHVEKKAFMTLNRGMMVAHKDNKIINDIMRCFEVKKVFGIEYIQQEYSKQHGQKNIMLKACWKSFPEEQIGQALKIFETAKVYLPERVAPIILKNEKYIAAIGPNLSAEVYDREFFKKYKEYTGCKCPKTIKYQEKRFAELND